MNNINEIDDFFGIKCSTQPNFILRVNQCMRNSGNVTPVGLPVSMNDLICTMLVPDPRCRITASEARRAINTLK
jgi:hypothetical protein